MSEQKAKKKKGTGFLIIGLLLMAAALLLSVYNYWDGSRAEQASLEIVDELRTKIDENVAEKEKDGDAIDNPYEDMPGFEDPNRPMETIVINGYKYIGVLDVPSLGLSLPVMEEWDYSRLRISPCRFSGSYYNNDLVIAGHNYARHFSPVKWAKLGSDVYFTNTEGKVYHYEIAYIETLQPTQVEDMVSGDWDLTMFTCNTGGRTRCAVRCNRIYQ